MVGTPGGAAGARPCMPRWYRGRLAGRRNWWRWRRRPDSDIIHYKFTPRPPPPPHHDTQAGWTAHENDGQGGGAPSKAHQEEREPRTYWGGSTCTSAGPAAGWHGQRVGRPMIIHLVMLMVKAAAAMIMGDIRRARHGMGTAATAINYVEYLMNSSTLIVGTATHGLILITDISSVHSSSAAHRSIRPGQVRGWVIARRIPRPPAAAGSSGSKVGGWWRQAGRQVGQGRYSFTATSCSAGAARQHRHRSPSLAPRFLRRPPAFLYFRARAEHGRAGTPGEAPTIAGRGWCIGNAGGVGRRAAAASSCSYRRSTIMHHGNRE